MKSVHEMNQKKLINHLNSDLVDKIDKLSLKDKELESLQRLKKTLIVPLIL